MCDQLWAWIIQQSSLKKFLLLELNELRFWVLLWSFSCGSEPIISFSARSWKNMRFSCHPFKHCTDFVPMRAVLGCVLAEPASASDPPIWWRTLGTAFKIQTLLKHATLLDAVSFCTLFSMNLRGSRTKIWSCHLNTLQHCSETPIRQPPPSYFWGKFPTHKLNSHNCTNRKNQKKLEKKNKDWQRKLLGGWA